MKFGRVFQLCSYLLFVSSLLTVFLAGGIGLPFTLFSLILLGISWWKTVSEIEASWQSYLVPLLLIVFALDWWLTSNFSTATVHLLILLGLLKILLRRSSRDYLLIYLTSFALILIASTFTVSMAYLVAVVVFTFLSVLTLILFENQEAYRENPSATFSFGGYASVAVIMTISIIALSVPIFLAIPRGTQGLLDRSDSRLTGFSDAVRLGELGKILKNNEVVLRVEVDRDVETLPKDLKWRGVVLDHYDGRAWRRTQNEHRPVPYSPGVYRLTDRYQTDFVLRQTLYLEPFSNVVFGAPRMIQMSPLTGLVRGTLKIRGSEDQGFFFQPMPLRPFRYLVDSNIKSRQSQINAIVAGSYPRAVEKRYLQLPELDPRISQLARELTDGEWSTIGKALVLENYLKEQFAYTLEDPSGGAPDPLLHFLLVSRSGHCEYFATAQAVMMRSLGIPSRVINGFQRGNYNGWGDYFIVRQSDAHSWVEAYFPGAGWIEFDPTPLAPTRSFASAAGILGQMFDSLELFWDQVITFDHPKQRGFFRAVGTVLTSTWNGALGSFWAVLRLEEVRLGGQAWYLKAPVVLAMGFLFLALFWSGYRYKSRIRLYWKGQVLGQTGVDLAREYYLEMQRILERKGISRRPSETPGEFAQRAALKLHNSLPRLITRIYYRNRFGDVPLDRQQLMQMQNALRALKR